MFVSYGEVLEQIKVIVKDVLMDVEDDEIVEDAIIKDDLGGDSLDLVDIAVRIERHYDVPFRLEILLNGMPAENRHLTIGFLAKLAVTQIEAANPKTAVSAG